MNPSNEHAMVLQAVVLACKDAELEWPPRSPGPVPLHRIIQDGGLLNHEELPRLSAAAAASRLGRVVEWAPGIDPTRELAGLIIANAYGGSIFVRREDTLPRRRFTAAHELGHYYLHFAPTIGTEADGSDRIEVDDEIQEKPDAAPSAMERQANRFAAELLMPEATCRELHDRYARRYGGAPRFIIHHLAGDLLVSRSAIAWRLVSLGLIDRPGWLGKSEPGKTTTRVPRSGGEGD